MNTKFEVQQFTITLAYQNLFNLVQRPGTNTLIIPADNRAVSDGRPVRVCLITPIFNVLFALIPCSVVNPFCLCHCVCHCLSGVTPLSSEFPYIGIVAEWQQACQQQTTNLFRQKWKNRFPGIKKEPRLSPGRLVVILRLCLAMVQRKTLRGLNLQDPRLSGQRLRQASQGRSSIGQ